LLALAWLTAGITACTPSDDDGGIPALSVVVERDGSRCAIGTQEMACRDVPAYIRDVARIEKNKRIVVTGDPHTTDYRYFNAVIESIQAEGYTFVHGLFYIEK
jgi:biopolymer transport protein ExbD